MSPLELGCTPNSHLVLLGLHRTGFHVSKSFAGPAGECQTFLSGPRSSQSRLPWPPLRLNHPMQMPLLLQCVTQHILNCAEESILSQRPSERCLLYPRERWLPAFLGDALHSSCQSPATAQNGLKLHWENGLMKHHDFNYHLMTIMLTQGFLLLPYKLLSGNHTMWRVGAILKNDVNFCTFAAWVKAACLGFLW